MPTPYRFISFLPDFVKRVTEELRLGQNPIAAWPRIIHRRLYYRLIAMLEPYVYGRRDLSIAAVSQKIAGDLDRFYHSPAEISVIYNGLDTGMFLARASREPARRLRAAVSRLETTTSFFC